VASRRLGRSLGVDLVPHKTCPYDCLYCQLGRTTNKTTERREYTPVADLLRELRAKLAAIPSPDYVTLSGSGEPTLHAGIARIIAGVKEMTETPVAVLTNGALLHDPDVQEAIRDADIVLPSLDAGDPCFFEHVNRPHPAITFDRMVDGMVHFRDRFAKPIWLEVFLLDGITALEPAVDQIAHHAARIRPDRIQLNTVTRPHAEGMALAVPPQVLAGLAERFEPKADVIADLGERGTGPQTDVAAEEILALLRRRPCAPDEIARGLGAHPLVVLKHLDKLLHQNRVALRAEGGRFFYHSPSDVCA